MNVSIVILLIVISFYILGRAVQVWQYVLPTNLFSGLFSRNKVEEGSEIPEEEYVKPKYDVAAYRERMAKLKKSMDDDGLYEVQPEPVRSDFTGTEVITEEFEMDLDEYIGRK